MDNFTVKRVFSNRGHDYYMLDCGQRYGTLIGRQDELIPDESKVISIKLEGSSVEALIKVSAHQVMRCLFYIADCFVNNRTCSIQPLRHENSVSNIFRSSGAHSERRSNIASTLDSGTLAGTFHDGLPLHHNRFQNLSRYISNRSIHLSSRRSNLDIPWEVTMCFMIIIIAIVFCSLVCISRLEIGERIRYLYSRLSSEADPSESALRAYLKADELLKYSQIAKAQYADRRLQTKQFVEEMAQKDDSQMSEIIDTLVNRFDSSSLEAAFDQLGILVYRALVQEFLAHKDTACANQIIFGRTDVAISVLLGALRECEDLEALALLEDMINTNLSEIRDSRSILMIKNIVKIMRSRIEKPKEALSDCKGRNDAAISAANQSSVG